MWQNVGLKLLILEKQGRKLDGALNMKMPWHFYSKHHGHLPLSAPLLKGRHEKKWQAPRVISFWGHILPIFMIACTYGESSACLKCLQKQLLDGEELDVWLHPFESSLTLFVDCLR